MLKHADIKKFNATDAKKIFDKLSNFYDINEINTWKNKVVNDINELFDKYRIISFSVNKNSYMGIVIECYSELHGELFIKVVPPMIKRFNNEVGTLSRLSSKLTCKIYEIDNAKNAIVMEKILPGTLVEFYPNQDIVESLFLELFNCKITVDENIDKNFKDFSEVVEHDYKICKQVHPNNTLVDNLYKKFVEIYRDVCNNEKKYLLHGDVYKNNAILSNDSVKLIDPLGFKGPFVMELVSICAYEMFYNAEKSKKEILSDFSSFFARYVDENKYRGALFCQLVKVYIPSLYEANDGGERAKKWLEIINELF